MKKLINILLILTIVQGVLFSQDEKITIPLRFDRYYTYDQVNEAMRALNKAWPELTTLDIVGKSEENREILAMTINNPKT